jgi:hypothetical protein
MDYRGTKRPKQKVVVLESYQIARIGQQLIEVWGGAVLG